MDAMRGSGDKAAAPAPAPAPAAAPAPYYPPQVS